jgi:hypothetical protein
MISYPDVQWQHESLKPVLEPTYGIILYQEQVMQIAPCLRSIKLSTIPDCSGPGRNRATRAIISSKQSGCPLQSGMVDNFIDRKHGREEISYPDVQWQHESLKPAPAPVSGFHAATARPDTRSLLGRAYGR